MNKQKTPTRKRKKEDTSGAFFLFCVIVFTFAVAISIASDHATTKTMKAMGYCECEGNLQIDSYICEPYAKYNTTSCKCEVMTNETGMFCIKKENQ